jgi:hypothetical protein
MPWKESLQAVGNAAALSMCRTVANPLNNAGSGRAGGWEKRGQLSLDAGVVNLHHREVVYPGTGIFHVVAASTRLTNPKLI